MKLSRADEMDIKSRTQDEKVNCRSANPKNFTTDHWIQDRHVISYAAALQTRPAEHENSEQESLLGSTVCSPNSDLHTPVSHFDEIPEAAVESAILLGLDDPFHYDWLKFRRGRHPPAQ